MSFELGKYAALQELVDVAQEGAGIDDVLALVHETLNQELEKNASEEDVDYKLGVESACHALLKCASEVYGQYDTSDSDPQEILDAVLLKLAEEEEQKQTRFQRVKGAIGRNKKKILGAAALTAAAVPGAIGIKRSVGSAGGAKALYGTLKDHVMKGEGVKDKAARVLDAAKGFGYAAADGYRPSTYKKASDERVEAALEILAEEGLI